MRASLLLATATAERSVSVWRTTQGTEEIIAPQQPIPLSSGSQAEGATLAIDAGKTFQTMLGFGGAFTESAALNMMKLKDVAPEQYEAVMDAYFGADGLGYTFARIPMGSCDFSPYTPSWSYDDWVGDFNMTHFDMLFDEERRLPWIRDAQKRVQANGENFKVFGSPWSAPGWMKTNGDGPGAMVCGAKALVAGCELKKDPKYHEAFARYFARWVKEYEKALGQPVWGITIMNEPQLNVLTYEGHKFTPEGERDFIKDYLGPIMEQEAPGVKIMILDHNKDKLAEWTDAILGDPEAAKYVWGTAIHWYTGDHFDMLAEAHAKYPDFPLLATEATESREGSIVPGSGDKFYRKNGTWSKAEHYAHDMIGDFNNWVTGFVDWNLVLDMGGGPLHINLEVSDVLGSHSAVHMDPSAGEVFYQTIFQYIGHFSKFVPEGAQRIEWKWHVPGIPDTCTVELTHQQSDYPCVRGDSFDCFPGTGDMWVSGGCRGTFTCDGVEGVTQDKMGHANRTLHCVGGTQPELEVTAFKTSKEVVAVVLNTNKDAASFNLADGGDSAAITVPAHSIQTFKYPLAHALIV